MRFPRVKLRRCIDYFNTLLKQFLNNGEAVISEVSVLYGAFIANVIDFLIVAFVMFMIIRGINNMKKKEAEAPTEPAAPPADIQLLEEIRDLLKK